MAKVYRERKIEHIKQNNNDIYKQAWKDCEDSLIMELRNHLTPLLNAVNTLESILKEEADKEALKQVYLKNETIKLMYEEIDNISTLNI